MSLRTLTATLGSGYQTTLLARTHSFTADEPTDVGGTDTAPSPYELLMGSLAACTTITLRMYAQRKQWPLTGVEVRVSLAAEPTPVLVREITVSGDLDESQRARLLEIADACPVSKMLERGVTMESRLT